MRKGMCGRVLERIVLFLIYFYQYTFSILLGPCCRFTPSCATYASHSIQRFGVLKGGNLALKRLVRCHPFHTGGYDPVPDPPKIP